MTSQEQVSVSSRDGQSIRGLALAAERAREEAFSKGFSTGERPFESGFIWLLAILCGWGWGHGVLFPLNAMWATVSFMWQVPISLLSLRLVLLFSC